MNSTKRGLEYSLDSFDVGMYAGKNTKYRQLTLCLASNLRNVSIDLCNAGNAFGRASYALHIGFVI